MVQNLDTEVFPDHDRLLWHPRQELNLLLDLRRIACHPLHHEGTNLEAPMGVGPILQDLQSYSLPETRRLKL